MPTPATALPDESLLSHYREATRDSSERLTELHEELLRRLAQGAAARALLTRAIDTLGDAAEALRQGRDGGELP